MRESGEDLRNSEHADAYESMLKPELLPGISKAAGYKGSYLLRKAVGDEVEFVTIIVWESLEAVRAVAGPDVEKAVIPAERRQYLSGTTRRRRTTTSSPCDEPPQS